MNRQRDLERDKEPNKVRNRGAAAGELGNE